jgi:hypothetical protein
MKAETAPAINNITLSPTQLKEAIYDCFEVRQPVMIWGPPGIGKSDIIHEIGRETNRRVIDIRLALWEPTDIRGIPYFDPETKEMRWASPSELPKVVTDNSIIFLDEFPSAVPTVQAGAYQLILNRKIGEYELPPAVDMVAAGNRENDRGISYKMPAPLANRFTHLELKPNFNCWLNWAIKNDIDPSIISFLSWSKKDLYDFNPKSASKAFATPRSWTFVNKFLTKGKRSKNSETLLTALLAGTVGEGLAITFSTFCKTSSKLPKTEEILSGKLKKFKYSKDISLLYAIVTNCCVELKNQIGAKNFIQSVDNFYRFMLENFPQEIIVMGVKTSIRNYKLPINPEALSTYKEFVEKVEKFIFIQD